MPGMESDQSLPSPADDHGMTLDDLGAAFAQLLGQSATPEPTVATSDAPAVESAEVDDVEVTPRSILEAMLFVGDPSGGSLSATRAASLMRGVRAAEIEQLVAELNEQYAANRCPYQILTDAEGYRLALREEFDEAQAALQGPAHAKRLSTSALEVISIVAYRGPLDADAVSQLRGKPSGAILAQLVRRQLLQTHREQQTTRYSITPRLLQLTGLASLEDLPRATDLEAK
jgi:segregation and condensation protein B